MCKHPAGTPPIAAADHRGRMDGREGDGGQAGQARSPALAQSGRRLMPDKSATALTAEYPRVVGRRIISRPDGAH